MPLPCVVTAHIVSVVLRWSDSTNAVIHCRHYFRNNTPSRRAQHELENERTSGSDAYNRRVSSATAASSVFRFRLLLSPEVGGEALRCRLLYSAAVRSVFVDAPRCTNNTRKRIITDNTSLPHRLVIRCTRWEGKLFARGQHGGVATRTMIRAELLR